MNQPTLEWTDQAATVHELELQIRSTLTTLTADPDNWQTEWNATAEQDTFTGPRTIHATITARRIR